MGKRLTDRDVQAIAPPAKGNVIHYDAPGSRGNDYVAGFGLRVTAAGARAFVLNYRTRDGTARRYTIGKYPVWSLAAARIEARKLKQQIDSGGDPVVEDRELREAPTVSDLAARFAAEHIPQRRAGVQSDYRSIVKKIEGELGSKKVASVTLEDIEKLHRKITNAGHLYRANRVAALASKMFSLAIKWKMRLDNPCRGVERNQESPRERYLSKEELPRLFEALNAYPNQKFSNVFRMLLLTGARAGEVTKATWAQFNIEAGIWTKPAAAVKTKKDHTIPLSAPARKLLADIWEKQEADEPRVFPGISRTTKLHAPWARICAAAKIENLRIHDLRHSYASVLASAGTPLLTIGKLLGHTQIATTQRYAHLIDDALAKATETAGAILTGKEAAEIVPMRRKRKV